MIESLTNRACGCQVHTPPTTWSKPKKCDVPDCPNLVCHHMAKCWGCYSPRPGEKAARHDYIKPHAELHNCYCSACWGHPGTGPPLTPGDVCPVCLNGALTERCSTHG